MGSGRDDGLPPFSYNAGRAVVSLSATGACGAVENAPILHERCASAGHGGSNQGRKAAAEKCLAQRIGASFSRTTPERMNTTTTASRPRKSGSRSSTGSLLHPFSTPRSPHTPSLPDARPRSDRFRCGGRKSKFLAVSRAQKQIPCSLSIWYDWRDDGDDPKEAEHRFGIVRRKPTGET